MRRKDGEGKFDCYGVGGDGAEDGGCGVEYAKVGGSAAEYDTQASVLGLERREESGRVGVGGLYIVFWEWYMAFRVYRDRGLSFLSRSTHCT